MDTRNYKLTLALKPSLGAPESKKAIAQVGEAVDRLGGKVLKEENLGIKTLSYPINKETQAAFQRFSLELSPDQAGNLRQEMQKNLNFLRVLLEKEEAVKAKA